MNDFLNDPAVRCGKHGKEFDADHCGECATLAMVDERIQLLFEIGEASHTQDVNKLLELHKKMERLAIIDKLFDK